jgi:hypothetical protein
MPWQSHQRYRLAAEKKLLKESFPHFQFYSPTENTYLLGNWRSSRGNVFGIRIDLPSGFPDECPSTYIVSPSPLRGKWWKRIDSYGSSHEMHCWTSDRPGAVKICTFRPEFWSAAFSLPMVALKAQLWLEALESHRDTGRNIADYLRTWQ